MSHRWKNSFQCLPKSLERLKVLIKPNFNGTNGTMKWNLFVCLIQFLSLSTTCYVWSLYKAYTTGKNIVCSTDLRCHQMLRFKNNNNNNGAEKNLHIGKNKRWFIVSCSLPRNWHIRVMLNCGYTPFFICVGSFFWSFCLSVSFMLPFLPQSSITYHSPHTLPRMGEWNIKFEFFRTLFRVWLNEILNLSFSYISCSIRFERFRVRQRGEN